MKWKDPKELTNFELPIIYWTNNNKIGSFKNNIVFYAGEPENKGTKEQHIQHWMHKVEKYNIKYWCYQYELDPNIINNS